MFILIGWDSDFFLLRMGLTGLSGFKPDIILFLSGNLYTLGDSAKRPAIRPFSFESVRLLIEPGFDRREFFRFEGVGRVA